MFLGNNTLHTLDVNTGQVIPIEHDAKAVFVIDADGTNPRKLLTWPSGHVEFDW